MKNHILLIEDDEQLASSTQNYLEQFGFGVLHAPDGEKGWIMVLETNPDLVLLDLMLPGLDGLELCRRMKQEPMTSKIPILMVTARDDETDRVVGLELGADDYVTKPYSLRELVARIRAILRRTRSLPNGDNPDESPVDRQKEETLAGQQKHAGPLRLDRDTREVHFFGKTIECTASEFEVLWLFASRPGQVWTREQLLDHVRGREFEVFDRSIDVHISKLRKKIEQNPKEPKHILTVWGIGYRFEISDDLHKQPNEFR